MTDDTIAAISSGLTESGIGIIRISGPESFDIAGRIFRDAKGQRVDLGDSGRVRHGFVILDDGETLDEVLLFSLRAPGTYTGEDTVEIDCHGGVLMMKRVLGRAIEAGARMAEPGEFTKRAFLNGRMDLTRAEAVSDLIRAKNDLALRAAVNQLKGRLGDRVRGLRKRILEDTAFIEAALDDPEHYSLDGFAAGLAGRIEEEIADIDSLAAVFERGRFLREGVNTAIIGKPNTGKSTLLNAMLGEERAIVSEVPGTTRDMIRESVSTGQVTLQLSDTAGIRKSDDPVERIGVERTLGCANDADLILLVIDASEELTREDREIFGIAAGLPSQIIVLLNKTDLGMAVDPAEVLASLPGERRAVLGIQAAHGKGIGELFDMIDGFFSSGSIHSDDQAVVSSLRHVTLLREARKALESAAAGAALCAEGSLSEEFPAIDLMEACRHLGEITGEDAGEELIDMIFSQFCLGK